VLLVFTAAVSAQQYTLTTLLSATNTVAASTSSNYTASATLTKHDNVALLLSFTHAGAGTDACTFTFDRSLDGSTWETTGNWVVSVAANGNTQVNVVTNLSLGAVGYLRIRTIDNGVAEDMTNIVVKVATKPKKNG